MPEYYGQYAYNYGFYQPPYLTLEESEIIRDEIIKLATYIKSKIVCW